MFFRKKKSSGPPPSQRSDADNMIPAPKLYRIDFDMMLKGNIYQRRKQTMRQYGVTVNGATRLVTSGDVVDTATYEALLAAGAIRPMGEHPGASTEQETPMRPADPREDEE